MKLTLIFLIAAICASVGCSSKPRVDGQPTVDIVSNENKPPAPVGSPVAPNPRDTTNRKERPDMNPEATPEATAFRPAAENSEAAVMMNADGSITEIRVFRDHAQLEKVEATWTDPAVKKLRVTLRGGKVVNGVTANIPSLQSAESTAILKAVGIGSKPTGGDRPRLVGNK